MLVLVVMVVVSSLRPGRCVATVTVDMVRVLLRQVVLLGDAKRTTINELFFRSVCDYDPSFGRRVGHGSVDLTSPLSVHWINATCDITACAYGHGGVADVHDWLFRALYVMELHGSVFTA